MDSRQENSSRKRKHEEEDDLIDLVSTSFVEHINPLPGTSQDPVAEPRVMEDVFSSYGSDWLGDSASHGVNFVVPQDDYVSISVVITFLLRLPLINLVICCDTFSGLGSKWISPDF